MNKTKTFLIAVAVVSLMACGGNKTERKAEPVAVEAETVKTDSRKNTQFATFHAVLKAVINHQPIPSGDDLKVNTRNGQTTITITSTKKKRRLFSSFVLTIDAKTSAILQLRMNERGSNYINYEFK